MKNYQISEDLFTDLLIYFGVQTDPEPTPEHYQQIHDQLALKVQAINNRINYKRGLGYERQTPAQNAAVAPYQGKNPEELEADRLENERMEALYEQGRRLGYHD